MHGWAALGCAAGVRRISGTDGRIHSCNEIARSVVGKIMETFEFTNIAIVAALGVGLVLCAMLHHRFLKKAVVTVDKRHVRGLRRYRQ